MSTSTRRRTALAAWRGAAGVSVRVEAAEVRGDRAEVILDSANRGTATSSTASNETAAGSKPSPEGPDDRLGRPRTGPLAIAAQTAGSREAVRRSAAIASGPARGSGVHHPSARHGTSPVRDLSRMEGTACCKCGEPLERWNGRATMVGFGPAASSRLRTALTNMPARASADGFKCPGCGSLFFAPGSSPVWPSRN